MPDHSPPPDPIRAARDEVVRSEVRPADSKAAGERPGDAIDRYKLLEVIGEGGMGTVWMAEQREPVKRRVALKIIKLGMDTKQVVARFEAERQALAMMDHPNIAKVLDAGATATGRLYLAMEYIKGIPILEYCDQEKVDTGGRLLLFVAVCHAIQHAHQKGIIHRDIKPTNVLVTMHDGVPVPKVIDFGIAKATNSELTTKTLFTEHRQMIGTPAYMSPEQAEMSGLDIDTRSDVYSLGVLLYELLTGTTPFDTKDLLGKGFAEMMRTIREVEPHKPSTRISTLGATATRTAQQRHVDLKKLGTLLRGDLDWIVMKCLEKDRTRRYETANGLAADIRRHLQNEPVTAGAPSASYRLRKFIKRNRAQVIAVTAVTATLVLGVIGTSGGMLWANAEAERAVGERTRANTAADHETEAKTAAQHSERLAHAEAERAKAARAEEAKARKRADTIRDFVTGTLQASDATNEGGGQETTILQAMDRAIADLDSGRFADDPAVEAGLRGVIGQILANNGRLPEAEALLRQSLETERRLAAGASEPLSVALNNLGLVLQDLGRTEEARQLFAETVEINKQLYTGDNPSVALCLINLSGTLAPAEAEPLIRQALAMDRRLFPGDSANVATDVTSLASWLERQGRTSESEPLFAEALAMGQRVYRGDHPFVARALDNLGKSWFTVGRPDEGIELLTQALAMRRRLFKSPHPDLLKGVGNLASVLRESGRWAEAEPLSAEALEMRRKLSPGDNASTSEFLGKLAMVRRELGQLAAAESLYAQALAMRQRLYRGDHADIAQSLSHLASTLKMQGRFAEAESLLRQALEMRRRLYTGDHREIAANLSDLGHVFLEQSRGEEAATLFVEAMETFRRLALPDKPSTAIDLDNLGKDLSSVGRLADAEALLVQSVAMRERIYKGDHPDLAKGLNNLGGVQLARRHFAEAEASHRRALDIYQRIRHGDHPDVALALQNLAIVLRERGRAAEAEPVEQHAVDMYQRLFPGDNRDVALALYTLGTIREAMGRLADAVPPEEAALAMVRRLYPGDHPDVVASIATLARVHYFLRDYGKAIELYEEVLKAQEGKLGRRHPLTLATIGNLGANYRMAGRVAEAVPLLEEAWRGKVDFVGAHLLDAYIAVADASKESDTTRAIHLLEELLARDRAALAKESPQLAQQLNGAATRLLSLKAWDRAEPLARESLAIREKVMPDEWLTCNTRSVLGGALLGQKRYAEAEPLLLAGYRGMVERKGVDPAVEVRIGQALERLLQLYEATGNAAEAAAMRDQFARRVAPNGGK